MLVGTPRRASASSQPFIGEIMITGANFAPVGWRMCDGSLLDIGTYYELFSLIGTYYGGDGVTTFALPDLRGRSPIHEGQGPGMTNRFLGESGGAESEVLLSSQMPVHEHVAAAGSANGTSDIPTGLLPAQNPAGNLMYGSGADTQLAGTTSSAGADQAHVNMQPFLPVNYCIAVTGIYPSRP